MMLGYLLARAGVKTVVVEKHADFLRDFRGDTVQHVLGHLGVNKMVVTIDRTDCWQCAFVIAKGSVDRIHRAGIEAFRLDVAEGAPFLANRMEELKSFEDVKLLSVSVDRLTT